LLEQFNYLLAASKPEDEVEMREKRKVGNDLSYHNCMLFRLLPLLHLGAEENFCHSRSFERAKAQKDARAINIVRGHQLALKKLFFFVSVPLHSIGFHAELFKYHSQSN
jgi:hypothetical protein